MKIRLITALLLSLLLPVLLQAQAPAPDREADHQALRELLKKAVDAINAQNVPGLQGCFAKEFVFTSPDQMVITSGEELQAYYERFFTNAEAPITKMQTEVQADILTRFTAANAGYCYGTSLDIYTLKNGRQVKINSRWTAVVVKENDAWKVAAVHVGVNFLDNPVMTMRTLSFWRKLGIFLHVAKYPAGIE